MSWCHSKCSTCCTFMFIRDRAYVIYPSGISLFKRLLMVLLNLSVKTAPFQLFRLSLFIFISSGRSLENLFRTSLPSSVLVSFRFRFEKWRFFSIESSIISTLSFSNENVGPHLPKLSTTTKIYLSLLFLFGS